jgi:hypothetical protein
MHKLILFFGIFAVTIFCETANAESIPHPLLELCQDSDLIVIAKVGGNLKGEYRSRSPQFGAELLVESILRGKSDQKAIFCFYGPNVICPSPPYFDPGERILAFLVKNKDTDDYSAYGDSQGIKHLSADQMDVYRNRIIEILEISQLPDDIRRQQEIANWLFKCAQNPVTRADAIFSLGMRMKFKINNTTYADKLSDDHLQVLYEAVLKSAEVSYPEIQMLKLTSTKWDDRLFPFLLECLRKNADNPDSFSFDIMTIIANLIENEEALDLAKEDKRMEGNPERWENRKTLVTRFIDLIEN